MSLWIEFEDPKHNGCIVLPVGDLDWEALVRKTNDIGRDREKIQGWARLRAKEIRGVEPKEVYSLPYAASPVINPTDNMSEAAWTLCYTPERCKGRSSCPRQRACTE